MSEDMNEAWDLVGQMRRKNFRIQMSQNLMGEFDVYFIHVLNAKIFGLATHMSAHSAIFEASRRALLSKQPVKSPGAEGL